jgi:peptidoglycan-associated lipoprotein
MSRTLRLAAPALALTALLAAGACATRPAAQPTTATQAAPAASTPAAAPETQTGARALPPVTQGGAVAERQVAAVAPGSGLGGQSGVDPRLSGAFAALDSRVFFDTDSYTLTDAARATLEGQARWMQANGGSRFLIAGNADERGTREYNLALGARRANAVRDYLISLGVGAGRLETVSYGKERPVDPRSNPEGWAVNRNAGTSVLGGS